MQDEADNLADLSLVPTDELVEELGRRCHAMLISLSLLVNGPGSSTSRSIGDRLTAQGLLMDLRDHVLKRMRSCDAPDSDSSDQTRDGGGEQETD